MQMKIKDKKILLYWILIIVTLLLIVTTFTLSLIFVNYQNQVLVTILSISVVVILCTFLMFILLVRLIPYKRFILWNNMISSFKSEHVKGKIVKINKPCTFKSIDECQNIVIVTNEKEINKFLPNILCSLDLKIDQEYSFLIKDIYIMEVKEEKNEK